MASLFCPAKLLFPFAEIPAAAAWGDYDRNLNFENHPKLPNEPQRSMPTAERLGFSQHESGTNRGPIPDPGADRNSLAMAGLRVAVGLLFLIFGEYKVFGTQFILHGGFQFWVSKFLEEGAYPFLMPVLKQIILPHATAIAFLVAYGELAIGIALVSGILVRAASAFGFIYMMSLLFSSNYPGPHVPLWQYFGASLDHSVLALCFLAFIIGRANGRLSLKSYLRSARHR